ncbi:MAG: hypothetical protein H8E12_14275 [Rhodobacteraceae bacterium]|nr:hypothetical protein [Paracoccaceae bacterium]
MLLYFKIEGHRKGCLFGLVQTKPHPNESTTPALKARGARRAALGSGPWVRGLTSFID